MKLINAFLVFGVDTAQACQLRDSEFDGESLTLPQTPKLLENYASTGPDEERYLKFHVFALPRGVTGFRKEQQEEIVHFVATDICGRKTYCTCLRLCERLTKRKEIYAIKSLVLSSSKPMYTLHRQFLEHFRELICRNPLYRTYQEGMKYRVDYRELLISALLNGLPTNVNRDVLVTHYPSLTVEGRRIQSEPFLRYRRNGCLQLPNYPFHLLLSRLRPENIIDVLHCLLLEMRVVLVTKETQDLGPVAQALLDLLMPFQWKHVFVPFLPSSLLAYLDAPVPFLMGLEKGSQLDADEYAIVDLDTGTVSVPFQLPSLPAPHATHFAKLLRDIIHCNEYEKMSENCFAATLHTQRAALTYFIAILNPYEEFFLPPSDGLFDTKRFIDSKDDFSREFYEQLTRTQMWVHFIEATAQGTREVRVMREYRDKLAGGSMGQFRLQMKMEVEAILEEYRTPLRVGLEELFKQYRPETVTRTPEPVTARPDSDSSPTQYIQPPTDRLVVGKYWYPLSPGYFVDFSRAPGKVEQPTNDGEEQMLVKDLDTGEYVYLTL